MMPEVSYYIPSLLDDKDKHTEVTDGYNVIEKQKGQVQIKKVKQLWI